MHTITLYLVMNGETPYTVKTRTKGIGSATRSAARGATRGPAVDESVETFIRLPTALENVDTHSLVQVFSDFRWSLKTQQDSCLAFKRVSQDLTNVVQVVDLKHEQPDINNTVVLETTLTNAFSNVGLVVHCEPSDVGYTEPKLQEARESILANEKDYMCGCILFTADQIKKLSSTGQLSDVLNFHDGGHSQGWRFSLEDRFWVYSQWLPTTFLKMLWATEDMEKPLFKVAAKITSAEVSTDGKNLHINTESSADVSDAGEGDKKYEYAQNPDNRSMMPAVGMRTQLFILELKIHVNDQQATVAPFTDECSICMNTRSDFTMMQCKHFMCSACTRKIQAGATIKCPYCRSMTAEGDTVTVGGAASAGSKRPLSAVGGVAQPTGD
jgi:hypothetical protein